MLKSKFVFGLVVLALILASAQSSYAQITITLTPHGSPLEVTGARNAATADFNSLAAGMTVSGALLAQSLLTTTFLTLTYPGPITSGASGTTGGAAIPANDPLQIDGLAGVFAAASISTINFVAGRLIISLPGFDHRQNTVSGSFRIRGVRMDTTGLSGSASVTASLSTSANNYSISTTSVTVITSLVGSIGSLAIGSRSGVASLGTGTIFTNATQSATNGTSLLITEGATNAWRSTTQASGNGTAMPNGTQVELIFTGIPSGLTLNLTVASSSSTLATVALSDATLTSTSGDNDSTITFTATSLSATETIQINITYTIGGTTTSFSATSVTVIADQAPVGDALSSTNTPTVSGGYPRFSTVPTAAVTAASIVAATTNMLIPYAVWDGLVGGFDTGVAIANTTTDGFGTGGAVAAAGTVTVRFYPRTATGAGTAFSFTTSTSACGTGLDTTGNIVSGGTWSVLLSQLVGTSCAAPATAVADFTGYIFIQANFLLGHGQAFITNFATFTSATNFLVLRATETTPRTGFESLGF